MRGQQVYAQRIVELLKFIPDFRGELPEYAINGDVIFIRWIARGTGPDGPFEAVRADRVLVPNGYVTEDLILSDQSVLAAFAKYPWPALHCWPAVRAWSGAREFPTPPQGAKEKCAGIGLSRILRIVNNPRRARRPAAGFAGAPWRIPNPV